MSRKKVFISYSHDSDTHRDKVLALSERLRRDGVETILDQYVNGSPPEGWPRWMLNQLDAADSVLVACTETYYRRFRGYEESGKGVNWEGALITQELYDSRSRTLKFVPVFLSEVVANWIPEPLRGHTYYTMTSEAEYQRLYDFLLEQADVEPGPVGTVKSKPRRTVTPLSFDGAAPAAGTGEAAKVDVSRIIKYAPDPEKFPGREAETRQLEEAWDKVLAGGPGRPHILTFVALGGEGKTSLVANWLASLAHRDWPGCEAVFAWSFYSQGMQDQAVASSDLFLRESLIFFGDPAMAESAEGAFDKGTRLARLVGKQRALLILDGLEPLQHAPTSTMPGELKDAGVAALLKGLAAASRGLCVVTTRYSIHDLRGWRQTIAPEITLTRLSRAAGVELLKALGVKGSFRKHIPSSDSQELLNEFEKLVEDVQGHALTLNLLGSYLHEAHGGDIRRRDCIRLEEADAEEQGGHAFRVMDAYVQSLEESGKTAGDKENGLRALALLRLLGLFDRPADAGCLKALWSGKAIPDLTEPCAGMSEAQRNKALTRLESARLVTVNRDATGTLLSLDAHPLLREYFAKRLREEQPDAWSAGHKRLFEHLCETTREGDQPTLEAIQPLYQAVAHGCQAGLHEEARAKVYRDRILRGDGRGGFYSTKKLGAFASDLGAVARFFETPWCHVSASLSETNKASLLSVAAFNLRALGRMTEALEPTRAGLEVAVKQEDWENAAARANNLSELELTLGEVPGAVADAGQSVTFADRSGDAFQRMARRTTHADALLQAGRCAEAEVLFCAAEHIQAKRQPEYPLLYSLWGFRYCDMLLTGPERAASKTECVGRVERSATHQRICAPPSLRSEAVQPGKAEEARRREDLLAMCRAVSERAGRTLDWWTNHFTSASLLTNAINHLTLGRAALYAAILDRTDFHSPLPELSHIDQAVAGLRRAGYQYHIPRGLLTRAWLRRLTGPLTGPDSSQSDLDEAWEIAERGPMPLFLADIHLYRARLFGRLKGKGGGMKAEGGNINPAPAYPWESPQKDLAEARRLIEKHGYWRRKEEMEDAEEAARHWHETEVAG